MNNTEYQELIDKEIDRFLNKKHMLYNNSDYDKRKNKNDLLLFNLYSDEEYFLINDLNEISFWVENYLTKDLVKVFCKKENISYISQEDDDRLISFLDAIITIDSKNYGICYKRNRLNNKTTSLNYRDQATANNVIKDYSIRSILQIHFENSEELSKRPYITEADITFASFLNMLFPSLNGEEYITKIENAVTEAKETTGLFAFPTFSRKYYDFFKEKIRKRFLNKESDYFPTRYYPFSCSIDKGVSSITNYSQTESLLRDQSLIDRFFDNKMYEVLIGENDFAKAFLSSEYLYSQYNGRESMDFTTIVSGYIKSIEILMKDIIDILDPNHPDYILSYDSMGKFCTVFKKSERIIIYEARNPLKRTMCDCFYAYLDDIRNQFMHKNIIREWDSADESRIDVKKIRNNTLFLYYLMLGATNISASDKARLGYSVQPYQSLYKSIINSDNRIYYYFFEFDHRKVKAIVPKYLMFTQFDDDGSINNYCFDIYELEPDEEITSREKEREIVNQKKRIIHISSLNMPVKVGAFYHQDEIVWEQKSKKS